MSRLLARAKVKLEIAKNCYDNIGRDDAYLDDCCFNLQQSIEMALKYLIETSGRDYIENYDIRAQLNKLRSLDIEVPEEKDLREMASTINSWEAEARYFDDFTAVLEDVQDAMRIADSLIANSEKKLRSVH